MSYKSIPHILIIGVGNIGSRHLQGLARIERKVEISVIDTSNNSIENNVIIAKPTGKERYIHQIGMSSSNSISCPRRK